MTNSQELWDGGEIKNTASLRKSMPIATGTLFFLIYIVYILFAPTKVFCEISAKQAFPLQIFYSNSLNFKERDSIEIPMAATFLSLPIGPHMPSDDVCRVIDALKKILS